MATCRLCNKPYSPARKQLGIDTCFKCGELEAKQVRHTIAPLNKSNYMVLSKDELKQLNPKRTT
jgi:ribosomal protein L37AE/L43A